MSRVQVNLGLVQYSELEGAHWFYDPKYPAHIQFLLDGKWTPYPVDYVKDNARDPAIRGIAKDADARMRRDTFIDSRDSYALAHAREREGPLQWRGPRFSSQSATPGASEDSIIGSPSLGKSPTLDSRASTAVPPSPTPSRATTGQRDYSPSERSEAGSFAEPLALHVRPYKYQPQPTSLPARTQSPTPLSSEYRYTPSSYGGSSRSGTIGPSDYGRDSVQPDGQPWDGQAPPDSQPYIHQYATWAPASARDTKIILSMDGDGIRGLSALLLVESLINAICVRMQRRLDPHQIFDLIGGVSTTGVAAIMMGRLRMRAHEARQAYITLGRPIFVDKINFFASLDRNIRLPRYEGPTLREAINDLVHNQSGTLDQMFFDNREDSTNVFVITTKVDIGYNQPALIRSYLSRRQAGPEVPLNLTTVQAMYAAVAAPSYGDPNGTDRRAIIQPGLVDLGTGKNNPVRDLYFECRKLYSYTNDTMVVISVGTGAGTHRPEELKEMANNVQERTAEAAHIKDKFETENGQLMEQNWMKYFRFNVDGMDGLPLEEGLAQEKIMQRTTEYLAEPEVGAKFYAAVDAICNVLIGEQAAWAPLPAQ